MGYRAGGLFTTFTIVCRSEAPEATTTKHYIYSRFLIVSQFMYDCICQVNLFPSDFPTARLFNTLIRARSLANLTLLHQVFPILLPIYLSWADKQGRRRKRERAVPFRRWPNGVVSPTPVSGCFMAAFFSQDNDAVMWLSI